jgi:putative membrane protein
MIKNIFAGISIGIANIIPGISGGTIIVLLGIFDKLMFAITDVFKKDATNRQANLIFLGQIVIGLAIGLIAFANIIDILFLEWPVQTKFTFVGLIIFSIPYIIKKEMHSTNFSFPFFVLGIITITMLIYLEKENNNNIIDILPAITFMLLIKMTILGIITGATTIFPGISGAMVLLIIGEYHLYRTYIAEVLSFQSNIIVPLIFIGIGILIGVIYGAKIITWLLKNYRGQIISTIIGLIVMSSLILIPIDVKYTPMLTITSIISLAFGGMLIILIEILRKRKKG